MRVGRVHIFRHKKRLCIVTEINPTSTNLGRTFMEGSVRFSQYHNGYVEVLPKNKGKDYDSFNGKIETDELTFSGAFNWYKWKKKNIHAILDMDVDIWFLGFDSAHLWNDQKPKSKTFESVKKRTIELCEEMIKNRI